MQSNPTVVLICPDEAERRMLTRALVMQGAAIASTYDAYPAYHELPAIVDLECDAFVIELDTDADIGLDLVEVICTRKPSTTVMVYAQSHQADLLVRCMQAGAREFLAGVLKQDTVAEALLRASARRVEQTAKKTRGKLLTFWGAKGGCGVTTLATNFALALRTETSGEVSLVDLNPQLGDVAVLLGLTPRFTINDALQDPNRMDEEFISTMVTKHKSGVSVLAAPDQYSSSLAVETRSVGRMLELIGGGFPYAVVDAGMSLGNGAETLFQMSDVVYLVTQVDITSLRNTQRLITHLQRFSQLKIELVINRYEARKMDFDEERLAKTVGMAPKWRVPNDYPAVRRASNTGVPVVSEKSQVTQVLHEMARAACGKVPEVKKKRGLSLFG